MEALSMRGFPEPTSQWEQDVWLMAQRAALVYIEMAKAIVAELGEEKGKDVIKQAIWRVGTRCGHLVRDYVLDKGLELDAANYQTAPDLPSKGWRKDDGKVTFCPLAAVWKVLGQEELGRIYCNIDPAKFNAYNPELWCTHDRNVLDGDECCVIRVHAKTDSK
jgi:hypothetical protein